MMGTSPNLTGEILRGKGEFDFLKEISSSIRLKRGWGKEEKGHREKKSMAA